MIKLGRQDLRRLVSAPRFSMIRLAQRFRWDLGPITPHGHCPICESNHGKEFDLATHPTRTWSDGTESWKPHPHCTCLQIMLEGQPI
jgi:hypothetical protein